MLTETSRKAIRGSIDKWLGILYKGKKDDAKVDCALCKVYLGSYEDPDYNPDSDCVGCPVSDRTGDIYCMGTPYTAWSKHHYSEDKPDDHEPWNKIVHPECDECRTLAQAVIDFLYELRRE